MKQIILTILFVVFSSILFSQTKKIKTSDYSTKQYYTAIIYLTEGKSNTIKPTTDKLSEIAYRLVITTSEIYDEIIIEKVGYGSEGGNKQIITKRKVDLESLRSAFNLLGEISGITFSKWISWNSFELKILGKLYIIKDISSDSITVSKQ
jgi:hypothetical protein